MAPENTRGIDARVARFRMYPHVPAVAYTNDLEHDSEHALEHELEHEIFKRCLRKGAGEGGGKKEPLNGV